MGTVGCPDEYEALIVDSASQDTIAFLPWSDISWQRVRNGWSAASVTIAAADGGIECCSVFGGLRPWSQMLRIERNGHNVWDGPIMGWGRPTVDGGGTRDVTVRARDRGVICDRRFLDATYDYSAGVVDYGTAMAAMLAGSLTSIPFPLVYDGALTGDVATTAYLVSRLEPVSTILNGIVEQEGEFYTCRRDTLFIFGEKAMWQTRVPPVLNETTVLSFPQVEVDATDQMTVLFSGGQSAGLSGYPTIVQYDFSATITPPLGYILHGAGVSLTPQFDDFVFLGASLWHGPVDRVSPKLTIEAVPISPAFGAVDFDSDLDTLMPGMLLRLGFQDTCAFNVPVVIWERVLRLLVGSATCDWVRVDQIDVDVKRDDSGLVEDIRLSCVPWIVDERIWTA